MAKPSNKQIVVKWLPEPEEQDYPAAESYLKLLFEDSVVADLLLRLKAAPVQQFMAKDIFRASRLSLLGISNLHVERDRKKVRKQTPLSPLLLVRDPRSATVIIADGYHRLCAVYSFDEDLLVPCKIV